MIIDWQVYPWHGAQSLTLGCIFNWLSSGEFGGRILSIKVITAQYRSISTVTAQNRNIDVVTTQKRKIRTLTTGG